MKLIFKPKEELPKLAWIANVEPQKQQATISHGSWVEVMEQGFIEGIWDGEFSKASFHRAACVFGSGAVVCDKKITFVSSTSTTDYLYWWSNKDRSLVTVANSLPLLLAFMDDELDSKVKEYESINNSITLGINRYIRKIPTKKGEVNRLMYWNLAVTAEQIFEHDKPLPPSFTAYKDYAAYLFQCYERLASNARDAGRSHPMAIFSTQSKGYDSTATNSVAKDYGIDLVFTVTKGKAIGYFASEDKHLETDDDGTAICKFFGLKNVPIERRALENDSEMEYLFYAGMHETGDFNLQQISAHIDQPTVLITGTLGELWYRAKDNRPNSINEELFRWDLGTHSLTEVRLQAGYVQLAFPYIGAINRVDILRITESEEMGPWQLGNDYDRPIPRRLAEEAGLERNMFGQRKMASALEHPFPTIPVNKQLRHNYLEFLIQDKILTRWQMHLLPLARWWNAIVWTTSPRRHIWNYYLQRALSKLLRKQFNFPLVWRQLNNALFCFCVNQRIKDYRSKL